MNHQVTRWGFATARAVGLAAALTAGLTACVPPPLQDGILPVIPESYDKASAHPAPPPLHWPRQFGSAELVALLQEVAVENLDVAAASARIIQAEGVARSAGSALYPQLNLTQGVSRAVSPGTLRSENPPFHSTTTDRFNLGLSASYTLDLFGRNRALTRSAEEAAIASRFDRDAVIVASLASTANSYFLMLAAQDRLRIARENIATADHVLQAIRARVEVGTGTALDLAQQESVLANQRANVPALEQSLQQTRNLLAVLAGHTPESMHVKGGSLRHLKVPAVRPGLPAALLLQRPDIAAAERRLASQHANVKAARAAFLPTINLTGSVGFESATLKNLLRPDALASSLAEGLTAPIFSGGNLEGQLQQAEGRQIEALEIYRKSIIQALTDVENALIAVEQTTARERLQQAVVEASRRAYMITEERMREGTVDVVTLLNTQLTYFQAQDLLIQIRLQRFQAVVSLFQALGGGWTREEVAVLLQTSAPPQTAIP